MVAFVVPGKPVAEGRGRVSTAGGFARVYTPGKTRTEKDRVRRYAADAMGSTRPFEGPLRATITVGLPIPASWPKRRQQAALAREVRPTSKPDVDNFAKLALDACNGVVYADDAQVVELTVAKWYAAYPAVHVEIVEAA